MDINRDKYTPIHNKKTVYIVMITWKNEYGMFFVHILKASLLSSLDNIARPKNRNCIFNDKKKHTHTHSWTKVNIVIFVVLFFRYKLSLMRQVFQHNLAMNNRIQFVLWTSFGSKFKRRNYTVLKCILWLFCAKYKSKFVRLN